MKNALRRRGPEPGSKAERPIEEACPDMCPDTPLEADNDKVGYKNPPKRTRFKKGRSGNPKGRPKGRKNRDTIARDVLLKPVKVNEGGRARSITTLEAVLLRLRNDALEGKTAAIDKLLKLTPSIQAANEWEEQQEIESDRRAREAEVDEIIRMMKYIVTAGPDEEFVPQR